MNQHFLVELADALDDMPSFARIDAPDADTAITTFLTTFAPTNQTFLDYVYRPAITFSFAEALCIQTDDDDDRFEQGRLHVSDELFAERTQHFFGAHHDYADLYLTYYFSAHSGNTPRPNFPPAMLAYIWRHTQYGEVRAIPHRPG